MRRLHLARVRAEARARLLARRARDAVVAWAHRHPYRVAYLGATVLANVLALIPLWGARSVLLALVLGGPAFLVTVATVAVGSVFVAGAAPAFHDSWMGAALAIVVYLVLAGVLTWFQAGYVVRRWPELRTELTVRARGLLGR